MNDQTNVRKNKLMTGKQKNGCMARSNFVSCCWDHNVQLGKKQKDLSQMSKSDPG